MSKVLNKVFLLVCCISGSMLMGMQVPVKNTSFTIEHHGSFIKLVNTKTGAKQNYHPFSYPIISAKWDKKRENTVKMELANGGTGRISVTDICLR